MKIDLAVQSSKFFCWLTDATEISPDQVIKRKKKKIVKKLKKK